MTWEKNKRDHVYISNAALISVLCSGFAWVAALFTIAVAKDRPYLVIIFVGISMGLSAIAFFLGRKEIKKIKAANAMRKIALTGIQIVIVVVFIFGLSAAIVILDEVIK